MVGAVAEASLDQLLERFGALSEEERLDLLMANIRAVREFDPLLPAQLRELRAAIKAVKLEEVQQRRQAERERAARKREIRQIRTDLQDLRNGLRWLQVRRDVALQLRKEPKQRNRRLKAVPPPPPSLAQRMAQAWEKLQQQEAA